MPSQKQSKRRRRQARAAPPPVRGGRRASSRRASPRVLIGAAVLAVLIVVGIVLGVVLSGGSSSKSTTASTGSLTNALPGARDVQQLLRGIPQAANVLGKSSAPVTMIEYIDLQCPYCQQFETSAMPTLVDRYVRPGKVKVDARIVAFLGPDSLSGRDAAVAAGEQNKLFNFTQVLYVNQGAENTGWLDEDMIKRAAASIPGVDVNRLVDDSSSGGVSQQENAFDREASAAGVKATPTILVGKSGGKPQVVTLTSPTDETPVAAAIKAALGS